jgi:uncharacterized protein with LGFP repeats
MARPISSARPIDDDPEPRPLPPRPGVEAGHTLSGSIKKKWLQLGGRDWGMPDDESGVMASVRGGRWAQIVLRSGQLVSIFATPGGGTYVVGTTINSCWARHDRERGVLGYPTSDEAATHDRAGTYQAFEGGVIVSHPELGVFEVHGDINAKYRERGGTAMGYPTTDETVTPDGRGRFNHFFDPASGSTRSIYWTPETGAHVVEGLIRNRFAAVGWERGIGYPATDELETHDKAGRYQVFEHGQIVWHPTTDAHAVIGAILAHYGSLGGSAFGYPTTDETATPDGRGRFNHFIDVASGEHRSIYWTPDTGSHAVTGVIRARWSAIGWERSHLGYPTGPVAPWPEGDPGATQQPFQHGRILVRARDNAAVEEPCRFGRGLRGGQGFGGNANMDLYSDGRVRWFGEVTNGAYQDYDYNIYALLRAGSTALAKHRSGEINMQVFGRNRNRWSEDLTHPLTNDSFANLASATFDVQSNHEGAITGRIDDVLTTVAAWAFTGALGPIGVGAIYLGISIGSVATGGSWESGPRIIAGSMWMLGPEGYLIGMAVDALARIGTNSRGLTPDEKSFLRVIFGNTLDLDSITLTDTSGKSGRPFAFPSPMPDTSMNLNLGRPTTEDPRGYRSTSLVTNAVDAALLAHEATHAWHYRFLANHSSYVLHGIFDSEYDPGTLGKPWDDYNIEQQATIVEEWVRQHFVAGGGTFGLESTGALDDPRFRYIAGNIRTGRS